MRVFLLFFILVTLPIPGIALLWVTTMTGYGTQYQSCYPTVAMAVLIEALALLALMAPRLRQRLLRYAATLSILLPVVAVLALIFWSGSPEYGFPWLVFVVPVSVVAALLGAVAMVVTRSRNRFDAGQGRAPRG